MLRVYSSLDVYVSSSVSEAFSNVSGEAMSCGVPCVITDVGDSALIVGGTGQVVPPENPRTLAEGIMKVLSLPLSEKSKLGEQAHHRKF
jgi:glycosyltransferase involved in cell wall biosynthesis